MPVEADKHIQATNPAVLMKWIKAKKRELEKGRKKKAKWEQNKNEREKWQQELKEEMMRKGKKKTWDREQPRPGRWAQGEGGD